jgi:hypothetical protein
VFNKRDRLLYVRERQNTRKRLFYQPNERQQFLDMYTRSALKSTSSNPKMARKVRFAA